MKKQSNKKLYFYHFISFLIVYFLLFIVTVNAQFELPTIGSIKPAIILNSDPLTSLPNSTVIVNANLSGITGGGSSSYIWFLNGIKQSGTSGLNKNIFSFPTGSLGTVYRVGVTVITPSGENLSDTAIFTVSDIDFSWNTSNEAPAGYRSKIFPTKKSTVTISAMPFIYRPGSKTLIGSGNLIFNWFMNNNLQSEKSGAGKSDLSFRVDGFPGSDIEIRLEILTEDKTISLNKFIMIPVVRPQTFIYKNLIVKSTIYKSLDFTAENYFFNAPSKNLKWQWFINNKEVAGGGEKPWLASLNLSNISRPFSAQVQVIVKNPANDLETAQSTINLND